MLNGTVNSKRISAQSIEYLSKKQIFWSLFIILLSFTFLVLILLYFLMSYKKTNLNLDIIKSQTDNYDYKFYPICNNMTLLGISNLSSDKDFISFAFSFNYGWINDINYKNQGYLITSLIERRLVKNSITNNTLTLNSDTMEVSITANMTFFSNNIDTIVNSLKLKNLSKDEISYMISNKFISLSNQDNIIYNLLVNSTSIDIINCSHETISLEIEKTVKLLWSDKIKLVFVSHKTNHDMIARIFDNVLLSINHNIVASSSIKKNTSKLITTTSTNNQLTILFLIENESNYYCKNVISYITYILNYNNNSSLASILSKLNYLSISKINSNIIMQSNNLALVSFTLLLPTEGVENIDTIISYFFSYIDYISQKTIDEKKYSELRDISKLKFNFKKYYDLNTDRTQLNLLSKRMHLVSNENLFYYEYDFDMFNLIIIKGILSSINSNNSIIIKHLVSSKSTLYENNEKNYLNSTLTNSFSINYYNTYISHESELLTNSTIDCSNHRKEFPLPKMEYRNDSLTIWSNSEVCFKVPEAYYYFNIMLNEVTSHDSIILDILRLHIETKLNEMDIKSILSINNNSIDITNTENSIRIKLNIFDDLALTILDKIISVSLSYNNTITQEYFDLSKAKLLKIYTNELENNTSTLQDSYHSMLYLTANINIMYSNKINSLREWNYNDFLSKFKLFSGKRYHTILIIWANDIRIDISNSDIINILCF